VAKFANLCHRRYDDAMSNTTMNISLPETLRAYVDERVAEGSYANASDYVRALIREDRLKRAKASLEAKLLEGLASPLEAATEEYWRRLEADARARISKRKRAR
jgi:antitoxin ParD1/3/4